MNRHFVLAALAGMLTIAVVGGLLYGVVFATFFRSNILAIEVMKRPPAFAWIALSHVPFGLLLALVVSWRGHLSARGGAVAGGLLGFLMAASYDLSQFGTVLAKGKLPSRHGAAATGSGKSDTPPTRRCSRRQPPRRYPECVTLSRAVGAAERHIRWADN
jgi:hypothetical protein